MMCVFMKLVWFTTRHHANSLCSIFSDSGSLRALDSSIKRNTAVIKKLKQINEEQREGLLDELKNVNLSKFVSEAVTSICEAKLRTSDIQAAVQVVFLELNFSLPSNLRCLLLQTLNSICGFFLYIYRYALCFIKDTKTSLQV